ncbi:MAG: hypothetical protein ACTSX6_05385 [Candidatus Heimdallarchaeaceae archaeon]
MTHFEDFGNSVKILFEEIRKAWERCLNQRDGKKLKKLLDEIKNAYNLMNDLRRELHRKARSQDIKNRKNTMRASNYVYDVQQDLKDIYNNIKQYLPILVREEERAPKEERRIKDRWERFLRAKDKLRTTIRTAESSGATEDQLKRAKKILEEAEKIEREKQPVQDQQIEIIEEEIAILDRLIESLVSGKKPEKVEEKEKIEEERKKITVEDLKGSERKDIETLFSSFLFSMKQIFNNMQDIVDIATVPDQTPEEEKILKLARDFQILYKSDRGLGPIMHHVNTFLGTIGEASYIGYRRMGIIRDQLIPKLNEIKHAYENVENAIGQKEKEVNVLEQELHSKVATGEKEGLTKEKEKEIRELKETLDRSKRALERLKRIKQKKSEFLRFMENYKQVHHQIVVWNQKLTGMKSKR